MKRPRDNQRKRAYDAEKQVWDECQILDSSIHMMTLPNIKKLVYKIDNSNWMAKQYPETVRYPDIVIKDGRGCRRAKGSRTALTLPRWSRTKLIVLHELAHTIALRAYKNSVAAHGKEWARIFLTLVNRWSSEHYKPMHKAFHSYKVKH